MYLTNEQENQLRSICDIAVFIDPPKGSVADSVQAAKLAGWVNREINRILSHPKAPEGE